MLKHALTAASIALLPLGAAAMDEFVDDRISFGVSRANELIPVYHQATGRGSVLSYQTEAYVGDLNGDGENEVIFKEPRECLSSVACRITVAQYQRRSKTWTSIGEMWGQGVSLSQPEDKKWADVMVHPTFDVWTKPIIWRHNKEAGRYTIDVSQFGDLMQWQSAEQAFAGKENFLKRILDRDLGQMSLIMQSMKSKDDQILVGGADLNGDDLPEYFLYIGHNAVCNDGCPLLIYRNPNERPFARLKSSSDQVAIERVLREGELRTIFTSDSSGSANIFRWDQDQRAYDLGK
ncbi:hypothetical protein [Ruegeria atlantica]|uniref:hypothetical protein n=1 Tax=Ruegeria atlantica TaxID=81569 RepID=UPI002495015C|nr:hypothetical protein [Ruegeria atlantica]